MSAMTQDQYKELIDGHKELITRLERLETKTVTKADVFQAVLTVHGFTFAVIVGVVVVLGAVGVL